MLAWLHFKIIHLTLITGRLILQALNYETPQYNTNHQLCYNDKRHQLWCRLINQTVSMQFSIYENLKHTVTRIVSIFKLAVSEASATGRPKKITDTYALTFALYQHQSTRSTKKSVYDNFKNKLNCSYKTFVVSVNRVALLSIRILLILMRLNKQSAHLVKYTDATDIPVCLKKNADSHKTMKDLATIGHSSKGWYYGLKMTLTRDYDGRMLALRFTKPGANDRAIFRKINADIAGIIVADAGYVSKQLEQDMYIEHQ